MGGSLEEGFFEILLFLAFVGEKLMGGSRVGLQDGGLSGID